MDEVKHTIEDVEGLDFLDGLNSMIVEDAPKAQRRKVRMVFVCDARRHLISVPYSDENMHLMAQALGIKKTWFRGTHYEIPKRTQGLIQSQCLMVSTRKLSEIIANRVQELDYLASKVKENPIVENGESL